MNPKPKGVSGSHFVGLDIFRRTLTVTDETKSLFRIGYHIDFEIQDNKFIWNGKLINFQGDYVILLNKELRIGESHYHLSETAKQVLSAGCIDIENGKITYLDNWSGHYTPSKKDLANAAEFFKANHLIGDSFQPYHIPF